MYRKYISKFLFSCKVGKQNFNNFCPIYGIYNIPSIIYTIYGNGKSLQENILKIGYLYHISLFYGILSLEIKYLYFKNARILATENY